jgi:hypothetical protein
MIQLAPPIDPNDLSEYIKLKFMHLFKTSVAIRDPPKQENHQSVSRFLELKDPPTPTVWDRARHERFHWTLRTRARGAGYSSSHFFPSRRFPPRDGSPSIQSGCPRNFRNCSDWHLLPVNGGSCPLSSPTTQGEPPPNDGIPFVPPHTHRRKAKRTGS